MSPGPSTRRDAPRSGVSRLLGPLLGPLLGLLLGVAASASWGDLVVDPRGFVAPTAIGGLLVVLAGVALRHTPSPAPATALVQLLVGALGWHALCAPGGAVLPTRASVLALAAEVERGAVALSTYLSPVEVATSGVHALLAGCGLLVVWSIDTLAHTVRQPPLAGLPVLVALSVPATVLLDGLSLRVFVVVAVAYLLLLASDRQERWRGATPATTVTDPTGRGGLVSGGASPRAWLGDLATTAQVCVVAVLAALLLAPLVPVSDPLRPGGDGQGEGSGGDVRLTTVNPFVTLRRDLLEQTNTPMVYATTDATDPSYLRTTVLDVFDEDSWSASPRSLPAENSADGVFPAPPGISAGAGGVVSDWQLQLAPRYATTWLPLPYPVREVEVDGAWRYDERSLDVALAFGEAEPELDYEVTSFRPAITARQLDGSLAAPEEIAEPMTEVPDDLPPVIAERAREVTQGAQTPYQQAVALQDWFREDGGFRYSLEQRPGSGLDLLASFVTDDRVGYCEQFAAAMAAMGRTLGIPSRVSVGFLGPQEGPDGRLLFTSDSRHAWTEMYFRGAGWVRFEPTPAARTGQSPDYTRESLTEPETEPSPTTAPQTPEQQAADRLPEEVAGGGSDGPGPWLPAAGVLLAVSALLAVPRLLRRRQRRRRLGADDGPEGAWQELRALSLDAGLPWDDDRSPRAQAQALVTTLGSPPRDDVEELEELLQQVERRRYARAGVTAGTTPGDTAGAGGGAGIATLTRWERLIDEHAAAHRPGWRTRVRRALLPGSLLARQ